MNKLWFCFYHSQLVKFKVVSGVNAILDHTFSVWSFFLPLPQNKMIKLNKIRGEKNARHIFGDDSESIANNESKIGIIIKRGKKT